MSPHGLYLAGAATSKIDIPFSQIGIVCMQNAIDVSQLSGKQKMICPAPESCVFSRITRCGQSTSDEFLISWQCSGNLKSKHTVQIQRMGRYIHGISCINGVVFMVSTSTCHLHFLMKLADPWVRDNRNRFVPRCNEAHILNLPNVFETLPSYFKCFVSSVNFSNDWCFRVDRTLHSAKLCPSCDSLLYQMTYCDFLHRCIWRGH